MDPNNPLPGEGTRKYPLRDMPDDSRQGGSPRNLRNRSIRTRSGAVSSSPGTILLVVIVVALTCVLGSFAFSLVRMDEPPPEIEVMATTSYDSWNAHVTHSSARSLFSEYRVMVRHADGSYVMYDTDGDAVTDAILVGDMENYVVLSAQGFHPTPIVFVDSDGDQYIGPGDFFLVRKFFFPLAGPLLDVTHGYRVVKTAPNGIPRGSTMAIIVSTDTLSGGEVRPGDTVNVTIAKGGDVLFYEEGTVGPNGIFSTSLEIPMDWVPATLMKTTIRVRPGEGDQFVTNLPFKVQPTDNPTKEQRDYYDAVNHPVGSGDHLVLIHESSNAVVLDMALS